MMIRPRFLILALTSRCNICCRYCYLAADGRGTDMDDAVLARALHLADHGVPCHIQITGGEPLLVPEKIARLLGLVRAMRRRPYLAIQTNATLLEPDLVELLHGHGIRIGVSLDGPPEIQEGQRGDGDATLRGLMLLERMQVPFRVTTVVTADNVMTLDRLALLLAGFTACRGLGLDLLVERGRALAGGPEPATATSLHRGVTALARTLARVNRRRRYPLRLREVDLVTAARQDRPFCHAASGSSLAVHPDGRLFPCGQTMGAEELALGTVWQPEQGERSLTGLRLAGQQCRGCPLENRCPGDCPSRLHYARTPPLACVLYRALRPFAGKGRAF